MTDQAAELDEVVLLGPKKGKGRMREKKAVAAEKPAEKSTEVSSPPEPDYTYDELLKRIYSFLDESNITIKNAKLPPPNLVLKGTKRVCITNYREICLALHRPAEHLLQYMQVEFGGLVSIDKATQKVTIKGKFQQKHIEKILSKYVGEYVQCSICKSSDTSMEKDARLTFIHCKSCNSRKSVAPIRQGYQAQVGKRIKKD